MEKSFEFYQSMLLLCFILASIWYIMVRRIKRVRGIVSLTQDGKEFYLTYTFKNKVYGESVNATVSEYISPTEQGSMVQGDSITVGVFIDSYHPERIIGLWNIVVPFITGLLLMLLVSICVYRYLYFFAQIHF